MTSLFGVVRKENPRSTLRDGYEVGWDRCDTAIAVAAGIATLLAHPVQAMLAHSLWLDEAWVAVLTRAPLTQLPRLGSSAPVGFVALARWVPGSGLQRGRLVGLGFSVLTVVAAYVLTRSLEWKCRADTRLAATMTALIVMLAPLSLVRNDLKQYTCDSFCALALLALGARAERVPTRASLVWLGIGSVIVAPFSSTALFVTAAVFVGLVASALMARARRRAAEIAVAAAATGGVLVAYFAAVVAPSLNSELRSYWASWYLGGSPQHVLRVSLSRLSALSPDLAMPAAVFVVLFVFGLAVLVRVHARVLAVSIPFLWLEMAIAGRLQRYPFLNQRTSQFMLVSSLAVVALGVYGVVEQVRRVGGRGLAALVSGILATLFAMGAVGSVHRLSLPDDDIRTETHALAGRLRTNDVIIVSQPAGFGLAYYWPHGRLTLHSDESAQGFRVEVAGLDAIYVPNRTRAVLASLRSAVRRWERAGPGSRLFIVRAHLRTSEAIAWQRAFSTLRLRPRVVVPGSDPLLVVDSRQSRRP